MASPDKELDRLYGLPLDEFTASRNELATRLHAAGEREAAETVRKLKKPSLPAWAINQLVRRHRKEVRQLLDAGERLRDAHERLLTAGDRGAMTRAAETERGLVVALVERAEPLLSEVGSPSGTNLERVRNTLHAAALDEELRGELEAGRVVKDREPVGLGPVAFAPTAERPAASATTRRRERAASLERELREARKRSERAEKRLDSAERSLERAREEAEEAHRELLRREEQTESARAEAEEAREEVERLQAALRQSD